MTNERIAPARSASRAGALLGSLLLALSVAFVDPLAVQGALSKAPARTDPPPGTPSIQYEEALAHAADPNVFTPGGRATVPLRSRPGAVGFVAGGPDSSSHSMPAAVVTAANAGLRREVFGFLPYWELVDPSAVLNYSVLSTIAYFSVGVDRSGNLIKKNSDGTTSTGWGGWTSSRLTSVINAAHQNGVRVVLCLTLFAWSSADAANQAEFLGNAAARANLATQAAQAVADRGADGINLDFEPIASGHAGDYTALVQAIRTQLDAVAPNAQLTFDTTGEVANYPIQAATAPGGADAIFVMGYDYRTDGSSTAGSIAPLNGPKYDVGDTLQAYLAQVPASKLILGLPWYGRAWSTVSDAPNAATQTGTKYGSSSSVFYSDAVDIATQNGRRYDSLEQSAWSAYQRENCTSTYGCVTTWRELYYDDAQSLSAKYDLANRLGLRGVGIWALGYDGSHPELNQALADKVVNDTTPPQAGIMALPDSQSSGAIPVSWTAIDDSSGVAAIDVQVAADGGAWTEWLSGTTATSAVYTGSDGHTYAFRVRATDGKGNVGPWDVIDTGTGPSILAPGGFARVVVDNLSVRAGPDPGAQRVTAVNSDVLLAITGGPVAAGGYTWFQVTEPIVEWHPVSPVLVGVWVASGSGGTPYLAAARAPNATVVAESIAGLAFGDPPLPAGSPTTSASSRAFSPNGDGVQDSLVVSWTNRSPMVSGNLNVLHLDGSMAGSIPLVAAGAGPQRLAWDGRVAGAPLPDGTYLLQIVATTGSGAITVPAAFPTDGTAAAAWGVTIDTQPPPLDGAAVNRTAFSPSGDGRLEDVTVAAPAAGTTAWQLTVAPVGPDGRAGAIVRTIAGTGVPAAATWDGRDEGGAILPDGPERLTLTLIDAAGNRAAQSFDVLLDTVAPAVTPILSAALFSPNGDGWADTTALSWTLAEPITGTVVLTRGSAAVRSWSIPAGSSGSISWDGRDTARRGVADGRFVWRLTIEDLAGNRVVRSVVVTVDRSAGLLRWSPGSVKRASPTVLSYQLTRGATVSLVIRNANGKTIRSAFGGRTQRSGRQTWSWDGRDAARRVVPAGRYLAVLTVKTSLGTSAMMRTLVVK